jgi:WhiB family redox-sensing transcriptional regulator
MPELERDDEWQEQASCREIGSEIFFPEYGKQAGGRAYAEAKRYAKAVCDACPVQQQCLAYGMDDEYGIFGGLTAPERARLRKQQKAAS